MQKVIHIGANCLKASCLLLATHLLAAQAFAQSAPTAQPQAPQPNATQQQAAKPLAYEVVSIKPSNPDADGSGMRTVPEGFAWLNTPLYSLLKSAYGVSMDNQFSGVPNWVKTEKYDIEAKVDADTTERWKTLHAEVARKRSTL
jgi:hypothetical protein